MVQDEERYVAYALNLSRGFYAPRDTLFLWNGPGYPLVLLPFVLLGAPLLAAKLLNAVFFAGACTYVLRTLEIDLPRRTALGMALAFSGYAALFGGSWLPLLMTEALCLYLVSGWAYHFLRAARGGGGRMPGRMGPKQDRIQPGTQRRHWVLAGAHLAALALTKVFFGYMVAAIVAACALLLAVRPARPAAAAGLRAALLASILCVPYLVYTHSLTGRFFYWANSGGTALYCLTAPERHLLGDIFPLNTAQAHPEHFPSQAPFLAGIASLNHFEQDSALRREALRNLARFPAKVFDNWRANVNRLVLDYPFSRFPGSHSALKTGNRAFVHAPAFFLCLVCLVPSLLRLSRLPWDSRLLAGFFLVSLLGFSLLSAYARFVFPLLPVLAHWLAATFGRVAGVRLAPP